MSKDTEINVPQIVESSLFRYFLFIAFFLTGATGLIYQVLWARLLVLSFGYTIHSISVVITAFMGGLAVGSAVGGIIADRIRNTVAVYGLAELGIGLIAVITYPLLTGLPHAIAEFRETLSIPYYGFSPWTFLITMGILMPPTILMGLTLPLLARALTRIKESAAFDVGALYSVNTMGAALGSIIAGFLLIAYFGVYTTLLMAASINIIIGITAVIFKVSLKSGTVPAKVAPESVARKSNIMGEPLFWAFGISGFAALASEVIWIRIFSPYLENSTYAFSLILGIFLTGIAAGGWAGRRAAASKFDSASGFGICQVLVGLATAIGFALLFLFIQYYHKILPHLGLLLVKPSLILEESFYIILILLPSTFFMGAGFPFIAQWAGKEFRSLGRRTGKLYAANTVGSILGAVGGGFLLISTLGTRDSLIFLILLYFVNGLLVLYFNRKSLPYSSRSLGTMGVLLIALIVVLRSAPNPNLFAVEAAYPEYRILAYREDPDVNVTLLEHREDKSVRVLQINLRLVSGSGVLLTPWMAHLPLMMYEDSPPSTMLNIGLGIGHTFVSALNYPGLRVDVVELVPSVAELFEEFNPLAKVISENTNGRVIIGDGRNYLLSAEVPYDVISIDPTPPLYGTGAVNLYTADFFEVIKEKLSPKGILLLRIPKSADIGSIKLLIRTAIEIFPHVSLWEPPYENKGFSLIASAFDYRINPQELGKKVKEAPFLDEGFKQILLMSQPVFRGEGEGLLPDMESVHVVTDDRPYLEFPLFRQY
jgi:spermidine synthase